MLLDILSRNYGGCSCNFLALQLFLFKLAISLPQARYVKIEKPIVSARRSKSERPKAEWPKR